MQFEHLGSPMTLQPSLQNYNYNPAAPLQESFMKTLPVDFYGGKHDEQNQ